MTRALRIEYRGAFYHVLSRGNQKLSIFLSDGDRCFFLKCLRDAYERFGSIVHVYCLMENHYHLFIETPQGGLSKIMHFINTTYSIYFNKKHGRCGHPFQGRYKAILVQAEEYAREVAPYIHLNPVRAGIAELPEDYPWSNYRDYVGPATRQPWTSTSFVLSLFASDINIAKAMYREYTLWRSGQHLPSPFDAAQASGILGNPDFVEQIKKLLPSGKLDQSERELPQLRKIKTKPELAQIFAATRAVLGDHNRLAKKVAMFITHKNTDYLIRDISEYYQISISGVSSACRKLKQELHGNETLAQAIREIEMRAFGG